MIPRAALILGLAGTLPFLAAAAGALGWRLPFGPDPVPLAILQGQIILSFMSGVIWGFAARIEGPGQPLGFALSVLPALWALFAGWLPSQAVLAALIVGFIALLALDGWAWTRALAPVWWMRLRLLLTGIVVAALVVVAVHA